MMVRCFEDDNIVHVNGSIDPLRDIEVINLELVLADLESATKRKERAASKAKTGTKEAKAELGILEQLVAHLESGQAARHFDRNDEQRELLRDMHLLTDKPVLLCCNIAETDVPDGNQHSAAVQTWAKREGAGVVLVCGSIEEELAALESEDQYEMLAGYGLKEPTLNALVRECYSLLGLQSYFTAGEKEIRAWTIRRGATAPEAAGVIHSDFQKGFIRAQVYGLDDLRTYESENAIKAAGKMRSEGKDYIVHDGDIIHFLFNV